MEREQQFEKFDHIVLRSSGGYVIEQSVPTDKTFQSHLYEVLYINLRSSSSSMKTFHHAYVQY
jgi:hypothetical protein